MAGVNKAIVIGNLGSDPEVRATASGQKVASFSIATNDSWVDKNGQKQERTEWHNIVVWGKQAENCGKYLKKGRQAYVEGRLQTREWTDKEGGKRKTTEIVAQTVQFLGGPRSESSGSSPGGGGDYYDGPPPPHADGAEHASGPAAHDDVPF